MLSKSSSKNINNLINPKPFTTTATSYGIANEKFAIVRNKKQHKIMLITVPISECQCVELIFLMGKFVTKGKVVYWKANAHFKLWI